MWSPHQVSGTFCYIATVHQQRFSNTVNVKNINDSNPLFQYTSVIMNEMDLLLKFHLSFFFMFKTDKRRPF